MTKRELEQELFDLRKDFRNLASIVSEVFVQTGALKSDEHFNKCLLGLVNKERIASQKIKSRM